MNIFKAVIRREDDGVVAFLPELDIASQGNGIQGIQGVRDRLRKQLELVFECELPAEIESCLGDDMCVTDIEISIAAFRVHPFIVINGDSSATGTAMFASVKV